MICFKQAQTKLKCMRQIICFTNMGQIKDLCGLIFSLCNHMTMATVTK